jgi:hypothetical protein
MNPIFRKPKRPKAQAFTLTDERARTMLNAVVPAVTQGHISYRWLFVRETRTKSGTLAYIYRHPFEPDVEHVFGIDFASGTLRNLGPIRRAKPQQIPAPTPMKLLPPPERKSRSRTSIAKLLGEEMIRRLMQRR